MKLVRLEMYNFRQYIDANIDFSSGVTGIVGPNGAGKTTILEAIGWALYGARAVRGVLDTVKSTAAPGGSKVRVSLEFELGGEKYLVERNLGSANNAVLSVGGRPLRSGVKEVDVAIPQLLGMDYQAFFTSFFTAQKGLEFMATLEGRDRPAAIARMLGYDRLTKAREKANDDRKGLHHEIEGLEKGLPDPEALKQRKKDAQAQYEAATKALADAQAVLKKLKTTVDELKPLKEVSDLKARQYEDVSRRLEIDKTDAKQIAKRVDDLQTESEQLKTKRTEFDTIAARLQSYKKEADELKSLNELERHEVEKQKLDAKISVLLKDIQTLAKREKQLSDAFDRQTARQAALSAAESALVQMEKNIHDRRTTRSKNLHSIEAEISQLEKLSKEIKAKKDRIEQAGQDGQCPTCERPLADELPKVLANCSQQLKDISDKQQSLSETKPVPENEDHELAGSLESLQSLKDQIKALTAEKSQADADVKEYQRISGDIKSKTQEIAPLKERLAELPQGYDEKRHTELKNLRESLQPDRDRYNSLKGELQRQGKVEEQLSDQQAQLQSKNEEISKSENILKELDFSKEAHEELSNSYTQASQQLNESALAVEKQQGGVNTADALLKQINIEEADYNSKANLLNVRRSDRLYLVTLCSALDKLKAELNDRIRPELESVASEFLAAMTDGRYSVLEINESYSAVIRDDGELKPVISGGENDVVNLALRLAVSQMIADRAGQSFSLLVLDEVFGSLDKIRRDNVVGLMQNLKNRFEQIIVITHIEDIHDATDSCLWVEYDEQTKISRLVDRLNGVDSIEAGLLT